MGTAIRIGGPAGACRRVPAPCRLHAHRSPWTLPPLLPPSGPLAPAVAAAPVARRRLRCRMGTAAAVEHPQIDGAGGAAAARGAQSYRSGSDDGTSGGAGIDANEFGSMLSRLAEWVEAFGSCHVPSSVHDARPLAGWVKRVRRAGAGRGGGELTLEQRAALDALGFEWRPSQPDSLWHTAYHRARAWCETRGPDGAGDLQRLAEEAERWEKELLAAQQQAQRAAQAQARSQRQQGRQKRRRQQQQEEEGPGAAEAQAALGDSGPADEGAEDAIAALGPSPLAACDEDTRTLLTWLRRQQELYRTLRLAPNRVRLIRRLGIKLRRQKGGPAPEELHPGLRFAERSPEEQQRLKARSLRVSAVTNHGIRLSAAISRDIKAGADVWALLEEQGGGGDSAAAAAVSAAPQADRPTGAPGPSGSSTRAGDAAATGGTHAPSDADDQRFMLLLSQLQRWYVRYGRGAPVPPGVFDRPQLSSWVAGLRAAHARAPDALPQWQTEELAASGLSFEPEDPDLLQWHTAFHKVRRIKAAGGSAALVKATGTEGAVGRGNGSGSDSDDEPGADSNSAGTPWSPSELEEALAWVHQQREAAVEGRLDRGRETLLTALLGRSWQHRGPRVLPARTLRSSVPASAVRGVVRRGFCRAWRAMAANGGDSGASYQWQSTFVESGGRAQFAPAADNNKAPILEVLRRYLPSPAATPGRVLEVASGTGQHVTHFAAALPQYNWQPSDVTDELFASIAAHAVGAGNVQRPVVLDASWPAERWSQALGGSGGQWDGVIVANMTHISPWAATEGLIAGAAALLRPGGILSVYGPFKLHGEFTTDSNRAFHERLVASNPEWGYRDTDAIEALAGSRGLQLVALEPMPANNFDLIFKKG